MFIVWLKVFHEVDSARVPAKKKETKSCSLVVLLFFFFSPAKIRELCPLKQNESAKTTQSMSPSVNLSPKVAQERLQSTGITVWAQYPQTSLKGHHAQHDVVDQCQSAPRLPVLLSVDA